MAPTPSAEVIQRAQAGFVEVYTRVDIYESDYTTPWLLDAPLIDGSISADITRAERRSASFTFANNDHKFTSRPTGFWYDKIIKVYRGIVAVSSYLLDSDGNPILDDGGHPVLDETDTAPFPGYETQIGEFYIDDITMNLNPTTVSISARDGTSRLLLAKFATSTLFASGVSIESVVQAVALAGGIPTAKMTLPITGVNTTKDHLYDRTTERWQAIQEMGDVYGYRVYFDYTGQLTMDPFTDPADPSASPSVYSFDVGGYDVHNGDFSDGSEWWRNDLSFTGSPSFAVESSGQQRSGNYALAITMPTNSDGGAWSATPIKVEAGEIYEIEMWSKATMQADGKYLRAVFTASPTSLAGLAYSDIVANGNFDFEYTHDIGTVTVPAGMSYLWVFVYNYIGTPKTAWFDDISVRRVWPDTDTRGNIVTYTKKTVSTRIYNHVVVSGGAANTIPVYAEAENNTSTSPTRIAKLGRRTYFYTSAFITTVPQAQAVADRFLAIHALESFEVNLSSVVAAWLEPGCIVDFNDPVGASTDPVRYLLSDITIPLKTGPMTASAKRVTIVG